jgi:hypothetical protein
MYCESCGKPIDQGSAVCSYCGAPQKAIDTSPPDITSIADAFDPIEDEKPQDQTFAVYEASPGLFARIPVPRRLASEQTFDLISCIIMLAVIFAIAIAAYIVISNLHYLSALP